MSRGLLVDAGRVGCRLRDSDIDIEHCLSCPWFRDVVESRDGAAYVVCRACDTGPAQGRNALVCW